MSHLPIVTSDQMKQMEKGAFDAGESEEEYMVNAGRGIAQVIESFLLTPSGCDEIYLLIGKGNNGGDAFVCGEFLLKRNYSVTAYHLYPIKDCSPLSKQMAKRFQHAGGKMVEISKAPTFEKGIIVDGLVGTGFKGKAEGFLAEVIDAANQSKLPIFAIDIPSGLNGNTGAVESVAISAQTTIYLGFPKIGFFLGKGWDHVGKLVCVDFGMEEKYSQDLIPKAYLVSDREIAKTLPPIERTRHKYKAGYVLAIAGSSGMSGAAIMSCYAALKAGAGIVRLFYPQEMKEELSSAPYELITEGWDLKDDTRIFEESKRAKAFIFGPGIGRSLKMQLVTKTLLEKTFLPTVIDADGLYHFAKDQTISLPEKTILTPHHKEMERILDMEPNLENCQRFVDEKKVTLVLKGAPTIIFHPNREPLINFHGDPGMAKAGTGDVLTGILAALLAQGLLPWDAAALGTTLHGIAGEEAAKSETSYSVIATDLIEFLPEAFAYLQSKIK